MRTVSWCEEDYRQASAGVSRAPPGPTPGRFWQVETVPVGGTLTRTSCLACEVMLLRTKARQLKRNARSRRIKLPADIPAARSAWIPPANFRRRAIFWLK
jgi:hypothetical protein